MKLLELDTNQGPTLVRLEDIASVEKPVNMGGFGGGGIGRYRVRVRLGPTGYFDVVQTDYKRIGELFDEAGVISVEIPGEARKTIVNIEHVLQVSRSTKATTVVIGVKEQPQNLNVEVKMSNGDTIIGVSSPEHDIYEVLKGIMTTQEKIEGAMTNESKGRTNDTQIS